MRLFSCIIIALSLLLCACASSDDVTLQDRLMKRSHAAAMSMIADRDGTFDEINKAKAPYTQPGNPRSYTYVYDLDLNVVAHPDPSVRGTNHSKAVDDDRDPYAQDILTRALGRKRGRDGWIEYTTNGYHRVAYFELAQARDGYYYVIVSTAPVGSTARNSSPESP